MEYNAGIIICFRLKSHCFSCGMKKGGDGAIQTIQLTSFEEPVGEGDADNS